MAFVAAGILAIAGCNQSATAQTSTVTLSWTAPTTYTTGVPLGTATITYNLYAGLSTLETKAASGVSSGIKLSGPSPGTKECWQVTAVVAGIESGRTPEVCVTASPLTPNPPTNLTVQ